MLKLNLTELRKILLESLIDPKKPGPWRLTADIADPKYYRMRAIEILREADLNTPDENINKAISLLLLARFFHRTQGVIETLKVADRFTPKQDLKIGK